jgi:hypothetical protein
VFNYRIWDGGNNVSLSLLYQHTRRGTMEQHYQLWFESLERQGPHLHDQKRAHQDVSKIHLVHTDNKICF